MKNWSVLPIAALVALLVGYGSARFSAPERTTRGADPDGAGGPDLSAALTELRGEQQRLSERLAALPSVPASAPASRVPVQDLDEAIAAYMAKRIGTEASDALPGGAPSDLESAAIADRIVSGQVEGDELDALWQKLRDEKRIDAVVAEIERQAALAPNNPDLQTELGKAYIQKLFDVGVGPMAGMWGEKADKAFDRALELDDTHWDARFNKAFSLSTAPTFLGLQGESVKQFEILMEQQERTAPTEDQAYTYYFLGNLDYQMGDPEKAKKTWQRGAARFPDNADLRQKTEGRSR